MEKKPSKIKAFFGKIWEWIKGHKGLTIFLIVVVVIIGLVLKIRSSVKDAMGQLNDMAQASLETTVERMDLSSSVSVTGTLAPIKSKSITSTLIGTDIAEVRFEQGDYVNEGDIIVVFENEDLDENLTEAKKSANISNRRTSHSVESSLTALENAQESLEDEREDYQKAYDKYMNLLDVESKQEEDPVRYATETMGGSITSDDLKESYEMAKKALKQAEQNLTEAQYNYEMACAEAGVKSQATKTLEDAQEAVDDIEVKAPISGYITALNVEAGDTYSTGTVLFTISDTSTFIVEATVDEYDISSLKKGQKAVVKTDATGDTELSGELTYVAVAPDANTLSSGTTSMTGVSTSMTGSSAASYSIEITLDSNDDNLRVGMTAKTHIILEQVKGVLAVPYDCVQENEDGSNYVTAIGEDGSETEVPVTVGMKSDYYLEISGDGVTEGMKVRATASSSGITDVMEMMMEEGERRERDGRERGN